MKIKDLLYLDNQSYFENQSQCKKSDLNMINKELSKDVKTILNGEVLGKDESKIYAEIINCDKCNSRIHYRYRRSDIFNLSPILVENLPLPCIEDFWCSALFFNRKIDGLKTY